MLVLELIAVVVVVDPCGSRTAPPISDVNDDEVFVVEDDGNNSLQRTPSLEYKC